MLTGSKYVCGLFPILHHHRLNVLASSTAVRTAKQDLVDSSLADAAFHLFWYTVVCSAAQWQILQHTIDLDSSVPLTSTELETSTTYTVQRAT